jgi:glutamine synthetase
MAGIDGIIKRIDPGMPMDMDLYEAGVADVPQVPGSLAGVLDALEQDHDFLLRGDVFSKDLIDTWIAYKRETEVDALRLRPHPYEYMMYYDV